MVLIPGIRLRCLLAYNEKTARFRADGDYLGELGRYSRFYAEQFVVNWRATWQVLKRRGAPAQQFPNRHCGPRSRRKETGLSEESLIENSLLEDDFNDGWMNDRLWRGERPMAL